MHLGRRKSNVNRMSRAVYHGDNEQPQV